VDRKGKLKPMYDTQTLEIGGVVMDIEEARKRVLSVDTFLSSKVAVATLRTLIQRDMPLPLSRIAKETGSNYVTVCKHMKLLKDADLVTTVDYGKRELYRANTTNGTNLRV